MDISGSLAFASDARALWDENLKVVVVAAEQKG